MFSELHSFNLKLHIPIFFFCPWLWCHSLAAVSKITTQLKQGRRAGHAHEQSINMSNEVAEKNDGSFVYFSINNFLRFRLSSYNAWFNF